MPDVAEQCRQDVFYKMGLGAIVCSCGFAVTFTTVVPNCESLGREHFDRMHAYYGDQKRRIEELERELREEKERSAKLAWKACILKGNPSVDFRDGETGCQI